MSIGYILLLSACSIAAILITLSRTIGFKNVIKYSVLVDFIASAILVWAFFGTFIGMMIAIIAGLMMAVFLSIARKIYKPKKVVKPVKEPKIKVGDFIQKIKNYDWDSDFVFDYEKENTTEYSGSFFDKLEPENV